MKEMLLTGPTIDRHGNIINPVRESSVQEIIYDPVIQPVGSFMIPNFILDSLDHCLKTACTANNYSHNLRESKIDLPFIISDYEDSDFSEDDDTVSVGQNFSHENYLDSINNNFEFDVTDFVNNSNTFCYIEKKIDDKNTQN